MSEDPSKIVTRLTALKSLRSLHEPVWRDCFDHTFPLRGSGFQQETFTAVSAQDRKAQLVDGTGTDAGRILASGIMGGATPANSLWFQLGVANVTNEEKVWLEEAAQLLFENIHGSNFDSAAFECCLDVVSAGWFALYIDQDRETGGFVFEQWPLSQVYCASTKRGGAIDIVYREFKLTAEQAYTEYGEELSPETLKLVKDKPDQLIDFVHAIYPRKTSVVGSRIAKHMAIASCHVEVKQKKLVRESGYMEMPVIVPRWHLIPDSAYAVGPASDALPDMRMLNQLKRDELASADIAISGMWIAEDDGVLNARTIKVGPRKVIVANSVDSMKPLTPGGDWRYSEALATGLQAAIRKTFMADQLQPQEGPQMTATEVHVRVGLIRQLLGPVYSRLQSEYLQPLITRCFAIAMRANIFKPAPASLQNRNYSIRYISPLARAQRAEEITAMDQFEAALGAQAQVQPSVLDVYDLDQAASERAKLLGVPAKLIRSEDDLDKFRAQKQQAAQAAQGAAALQTGAASFADTAGKKLASVG